jgi:hypothetical protein
MKRQIAKEWLLFVGTFIPFFLLGAAAYIYVYSRTKEVSKESLVAGLLTGLGIFLVTNLVRSVFWAVRTLKAK